MLQDEARQLLKKLLDCWFPKCVEEVGFYQTFSRQWDKERDGAPSLVFQSRMTWAAASASEAFPEKGEELKGYARHGVASLQQLFADLINGGFAWLGDQSAFTAPKRLYGLAFSLFALSSSARVLDDLAVKDLASGAFEWIDDHLYDKVHGGYFEICEPYGTPLGRKLNLWLGPDELKSASQKTLNAQMHMFEALLELWQIWPSERVESRIHEFLEILKTRIFQSTNRLCPRFERNWKAISTEWEIGHDLEIAYLCLYAEKLLGSLPEVQTIAISLIRECVAHGFDHKLGGFHEGSNEDGSLNSNKGWWTQMEGLNALVYGLPLLEDRSVLERHWSWIRDRQWDQEFGGFFPLLSQGGAILDGRKGHMWKAIYHDTRALLNAMQASA